MKRLLLACCVLFSTQVLFAQIISSKQVTIRQPEKIEKPKKEYPHAYKSGYRGFVEGALSLNFTGHYMTGFDVLTTHGYQCGSLFYIGAGVGVLGTEERSSKDIGTCYLSGDKDISIHIEDYYPRESTIVLSLPIYVDARLYMSKTKVKPFLDVKIGYLAPLTSKNNDYIEMECMIPNTDEYREHWSHHDQGFYSTSNLPHTTIQYNGLYSQIGLGIESKHMTFGINYSIRGYQEDYYDNNASIHNSQTRLNSYIVTFNVGMHF